MTSYPDFCQVGDKIIGFDSEATLGNPVNYSPNVITAGQRTYRVGDLCQGTEGNDGSGVGSGTSQGSGHVLFLTGQDNVKANGQPVVHDGSECTINCNAAGVGGAKGYVHTNTETVNSQPEETSESLSVAEQLQQEAQANLERAGELRDALDDNPNGKTVAETEALYAQVQQLVSETQAQQEALMEAHRAGIFRDNELVESSTWVDEAANRAFDQLENAERQTQYTSDVGHGTRQVGDFAAEMLLTPYGLAKDTWEFGKQVVSGHYMAATGVALVALVSVIPGVRLFRRSKSVDDIPKNGGGNRSEAPDDGVSVSDSGRDLQATLPRPYINAETRRALGSPPEGMKNPHIHHVLEVNGRQGPHRAAVREGQDILRKHGIDPLQGIENLTYAPNKGHTRAAAEALVDDLKVADELGLGREHIVDILGKHGNIAARR